MYKTHLLDHAHCNSSHNRQKSNDLNVHHMMKGKTWCMNYDQYGHERKDIL